MNAAVSALTGRGKGGANFRGMVAVVINHRHAPCLALELEAAVHSAEARQRIANVILVETQPHAYGDRRGSVQHVVSAGT